MYHQMGLTGFAGSSGVTKAIIIDSLPSSVEGTTSYYRSSAISPVNSSSQGFRPCKSRMTNSGVVLPTKIVDFDSEFSTDRRRFNPSAHLHNQHYMSSGSSSSVRSLDSSSSSSISPAYAISAESPLPRYFLPATTTSSPEGLIAQFSYCNSNSHCNPPLSYPRSYPYTAQPVINAPSQNQYVMNAVSLPFPSSHSIHPATVLHHSQQHLGIPFAPIRVPTALSKPVVSISANISSAWSSPIPPSLPPSILDHLIGLNVYTIRQGCRFREGGTLTLLSSGDVMVIGHCHAGKELIKYIRVKFRDSISILLTALVYLELIHLKQSQRRNLSERTLIRRFIVCVIIASKWLDDDHPDNSQWAQKFGISVKTLNKEERRLLGILGYDISVSKGELERVAEYLYPWCDPLRC